MNVVEEKSRRSMGSQYMQWARTHSRARFNLATSGLANVKLEELQVSLDELEITAEGDGAIAGGDGVGAAGALREMHVGDHQRPLAEDVGDLDARARAADAGVHDLPQRLLAEGLAAALR